MSRNIPETQPAAARPTMREMLRQMGSNLLPHDTRKTTCPPAPLVSGKGPLIIVTSLMRSGTHLLLDALFNNFRELRRVPLFLDFDAYERGKLPPQPLASVEGVTIKTHFPQTGLAEPYEKALASLAARAVVLMPRRSSEEVRRSLAKWDMNHSPEEFRAIEERFESYWAPYSPLVVDFPTLIDPVKIREVIKQIASRTRLEQPSNPPVMPARSRWGIYLDKCLTRMLGARAPRINTTIGYRLAPKRRA